MNLSRKMQRQHGKRERAVKKGTPYRRHITVWSEPVSETAVRIFSVHATKSARSAVRVVSLTDLIGSED